MWWPALQAALGGPGTPWEGLSAVMLVIRIWLIFGGLEHVFPYIGNSIGKNNPQLTFIILFRGVESTNQLWMNNDKKIWPMALMIVAMAMDQWNSDSYMML